MKSVNIVTVFFDSDLSDFMGNAQFGKKIKKIVAKKDIYGQKNIINNICIVTFFNAMSSDEDEELTNKYDILWTFGHLEDDNFVNEKIAISDIDVSVNKIDKIENVTCKSFTNQFLKINLENYEVKTPGKYYLKVYLRKKNGDQDAVWQAQSINHRYLINKNKAHNLFSELTVSEYIYRRRRDSE